MKTGARFGCALLALVALASAVGCSAHHRAATPARTLADGSATCPVGIDPITPSDAELAYEAVLQLDHVTEVQQPRRSVLPAPHAGDRGAPVSYGCGAQTAARTFVVESEPADAHGSASLAQSVAYVSHRGSHWFVWAEPH